MKKCFSFIVILCGLGLGSLVSAQTNFDILNTAFNSAMDPITSTDVERPGWPNGRVCVEAEEANKNTDRLSFVSVGLYTRYEGAHGELLPPKEINKVLYQTLPGYREIFMAKGEFDNTISDFQGTEIISRTTNGNGTVFSTLTVRKKEDWLIFSRVVGSGRKRQKSVGYCYHGAAPRIQQLMEIK